MSDGAPPGDAATGAPRSAHARRVAKFRSELPRRFSLSRSERPARTADARAPPLAGASETQSESAAMPPSTHTPQRTPALRDAELERPGGDDAVFPRRIVQWITRVANSRDDGAADASADAPPNSIPPPPPSAPQQLRREVRRRRHNRITRPVPAEASAPRRMQLSDRWIPVRSPSRLWQMTSDRLLWPGTSDAGVWLLGTYYGPADAPASAGSDAPSADTAASERSSSDTSSSASPRRAWRAELAAAVGSLVWCTYRSHFPPIAQDGFIGADEEATSAAVSAATEELCAPHDAAEDATDSTSSAGEAQAPLTQLLARSRSELGSTAATRGWLVQQLASRGWQLPGLLAQLPVTAGLLSRQEPVTPAAVATSLQAILDAVEHDVLYALPRPLTASAPFARLRDSLVSSLPTPTGLPGVWGYVKAIYESVSSIAQPAGPTSDAGWGCVLRTVQSLLATALVRVHLGRTWRLPPVRDGRVQWRSDEEHATYTRILTLFLDDPSSACPFSIHRLAAEGKRLGIDVGAWFGPSTAASVVQRLAQPTHLGVGVAATNDGLVYVDEVVAASHDWARPVLVLVAQRLGLDEVPKAYRTALKQLFSFPQSVGVAGGRPSSSVYFVGSQREHLLYLDPHTTRASVPFRHAPPSLRGAELLRTTWGATGEARSQGTEGQGVQSSGPQPSGPQPSGPKPSAQPNGQSNGQPNGQPNSQPSAQPSAQPNGQPNDQPSTQPNGEPNGQSSTQPNGEPNGQSGAPPSEPPNSQPNSQPGAQPTAQPTAPQSDSPVQPDGSPGDSTPQPKRTDRVAASDPAPDGLACDDPPPPDDATRTLLTSWYCNAYAPAELATFRTTSTQQMPLGVVDPSVLLGFVVHTRAELDDLARRAEQLGAPLFRVAPHRLTYASSDAASDVASDAASDTDSSWAL